MSVYSICHCASPFAELTYVNRNQGTNRIGLMSTYETPQAGQTANMNNADDEKQCPLCLNLFSQDHPSQKTQCCHRLVGISCYTRALSEDTHCDLCKYKFRRLKPDPVILTEQHHHIRRFQDRDSEENSSANLRNGGTTIITPGQSLDISSDAENLHDQRKDMANQWSTISNDKGKNIEGTNTSLKTMSAGSVEKEGQGVGPSYPDTSDQINSSGVHGGLGSDVSLVKPLASQQPKDHSVQSLLSPSISHHSGPALATPKPLAISQDTLLDLESLDLKATDYFKPFPTLEPGATLKQTDQTEHLLNSSGKAYINGGSPADTNNHGMTRAHEAIEKYRASCENLGFENHEAILGQLIRELSDIAGKFAQISIAQRMALTNIC